MLCNGQDRTRCCPLVASGDASTSALRPSGRSRWGLPNTAVHQRPATHNRAPEACHTQLCTSVALVLQVAASAAWYVLSPASPARQPWTGGEAVAAAAAAAGHFIRAWCFATLGRLFTYEVGIRAGHELVTTGPYALLLHPSYLGTGMLVAGYIWFWGGPRTAFRRPAWSAALAVAGLVILVGRVSNEERVLAAHFGERWAAHASTRWRFIPYVI